MSVIHNIISKSHFDFHDLNKIVNSKSDIKYEDRGNTFYYWIDKKSTRGLDISIEGDLIEIRNTVLSNKFDYELTNFLMSEILSLTNGLVYDEEENQIFNLPIFSNEKIEEIINRDCELIQVFSKEKKNISIFGPIRKAHFGENYFKKIENLKGAKLSSRIFETILVVNYQIPNFEYGNIMQLGESEDDRKTLKLLTNETNYIIDKYDFILIDTSEEQPIMITNEILNTILPTDWQLMDEYTIVAPIIGQEQWDKLVNDAREYDVSDRFINN